MIDKLFYTYLNERLKHHSLRRAAKLIGISPATLNRIQNGSMPDLRSFVLITKWLGFTIIPLINEKFTNH